MKKGKTTLAGREVCIGYSFMTEIGFQNYTGINLSQFNVENVEQCIYLILSSVVTYYQGTGETSPVKDEDLLSDLTPDELKDTLETIMRLRADFYNVPLGETSEEPEEDGEKNQ